MNKKQKSFLWTFLLISPFAVFLFAVLLGSDNCLHNYFCYGYPAWLKHSAYYDFFFLRADYSGNVLTAHWSSELLIALFPFVVLGITKKVDFAFSATFFYAVQHEIMFMATMASYGSLQTLKATIWFLMYVGISVYVLIEYRKVFLTKEYLLLVMGYFIYMLGQWAYWLSQGQDPTTTIGFQFDETGTVSWLVWTSLILLLIWRKRKCLT